MNQHKQNTTFNRPSNLNELIGLASEKFKDRPFIGEKDAEGCYQWVTYKEVYARIQDFSAGLVHLDVKKGDYVGIIFKNSAEWCIAAFACYKIGAIFTPINDKELFITWEQIIHKSNLKVLIIPNHIYKITFDIVNQSPSPIKTIIVDSTGNNSFKHVEQLGKENPLELSEIDPSDLANLIYTSGSSGNPKGVYSSHANILSVVFALKEHFPNLTETERAFSIFPWSHIAGLVDELYFGIYLGASIAVRDKRSTLMKDLKEIKPTVIATAPILLYRFYENIQKSLNEEGTFIRVLFNTAIMEYRKKQSTGKESFLYKILNNLILQNIRQAFGGELKMVVVGGAAMSPEISNFFIDLGVDIYQGYGLTETTGMLTFNSPNFPNRVSSVGKPLKNMNVLIDKSRTPEGQDYGEIIAYGSNITVGYHENHELNERAKTEDGGFRTGDLGRIDPQGYLYIAGRLKEEYKLSNGKYIHPSLIEEEIKLNFYVDNAMVYGENQPYNVCLVVPNFDNLKNLTTRLNIYSADHEELIKEKITQEFLDTEITNQLTNKFTPNEIPQKFLYISQNFSIENGLLTNTLKIKRNAILAKYRHDLMQLFKENKTP